MEPSQRKTVTTRIAQLLIFMTFACTALLLRLGWLQLWHYEHYAALALNQRSRGERIEPARGRIVDRNLHPLAMSIYSDALYARPERIPDTEGAAARLAELLQLDKGELLRRLNMDAPAVTLAIRLEPERAEAARDAAIPGIYLEPRPQRFYPHGGLAANVLGFAGADNQGLEGLEFHYDHLLRGTPGRRLSERDASGRSIPKGKEETLPAVPGHNLVLTIDHTLQYLVEQRLRQAVEETKATWGAVVMLQPKTGEVLAMAQHPSYDPHTFGAGTPFRNRIVSDQIEPGSTLKAVVLAIALELGVVAPHDVMEDAAELFIGGGRVRGWRYPRAFGPLTMEEALAQSSNTIFARLGGEMIPHGEFARYLRAFGFGEPLRIDFPGEARGFVPTPGRIYGETLRWANVAFGQGIAVTPLQLANAFAALVNGGYVMRPYIVQEIRDAAGRTVMTREPEVIRQVISPRTGRQMMRALEKVVVEGTGSRARIEGYRVVGKTGTAQIPVPGGYGDGRIASFIGAAPAEDPEVVTLVVLYDVQTEVRFGGDLAAPVFADVTELALEHRHIPRGHLMRARGGGGRNADGFRNTGAPVSVGASVRPPRDPLPAPLVYGLESGAEPSTPAAEAVSTSIDVAEAPPLLPALPPVPVGDDWWHAYQAPAGDTALPAAVTVPDVSGATMRTAIDALEAAGLTVRIEGSGLAVKQSPAPGETVPPYTPVTVYFQLPAAALRWTSP